MNPNSGPLVSDIKYVVSQFISVSFKEKNI